MTILYGQLRKDGNIVYGQLDEPLGTAYSISAPAVLTLSNPDSPTLLPVYEVGLDADITVYDAGTQELLPPGGPGVYQITGASRVTLFDAGTFEYILSEVTYTLSDPVTLSLIGDNSTMLHYDGGAGDIIASDPSRITLVDNGLLSYVPIADGVGYSYPIEINQWLSAEPSENELDFSALQNVGRFKINVSSNNVDWIDGIGPLGGKVHVVAELIKADGSVLPMSSLSSQYDTAVLFESGYSDFFDLAGALLSGPVKIRTTGYEAFPEYSIPLEIPGFSTVTVQATR